MRGLGGAVLVSWLVVACSGSTTQGGNSGGAGGSATTAGASGGSAITAGGGNGGAVTAGAGGVSGSSSVGGSSLPGLPGAHHVDCGADCGGDPVGKWLFISSTSCNVIPVSGRPPQPEECTLRLVPNSRPGEPPAMLEQVPHFDLSGQPLDYSVLSIHEDGTYTQLVVYAGKGHLELAASCRKVGDATVACGDLKAIAEPALVNEGTGSNFSCVDNAQGGCDCSYDVSIVGGPAGTWQKTPEGKLLFEPSNPPADGATPQPVTYCAKETLALGPELRIPGQSTTGEPTVFARVDCTDVIKGPGEEGIDCGGPACPPCQ